MRFLLTLSCRLHLCTYSSLFSLMCIKPSKPSIKLRAFFPPRLSFLYSVPMSGVGTKFDGFVNKMLTPYTKTTSSFTLHSIFINIELLFYFFLQTNDWLPNNLEKTTHDSYKTQVFIIILLDWRSSYFCWFLIR